MNEEITSIVKYGITLVKNTQREDGSFTSLSRFERDDFLKASSYITTFFASTILSCLSSLGKISGIEAGISADLKNIQKRAAKFLLDEMNPGGSWNYWSRTAKEWKTMPYPDDLDDTFAALAALQQYDPKLIDGKVLASVAKLLTALEVRVGGPYRTWLVDTNSDEKWKDVDIVANSTIAYFLLLMDVRLPNLDRFMDEAIRENNLVSPYYPGLCQVAYFVARAYRGKHKEILAGLILAHLEKHGPEITPLERAMAITSLVNLGFAEKIPGRELENLSERIKKEGFKPYAFCIDPLRDGKTSYAGASALTAAFCVEAFAKYSKEKHAAEPASDKTAAMSDRTLFFEKIKTAAKRECETSGKCLGKIALKKIEAVTDEKIILLAKDFQQSLGKRGSSIPAETIERLSLANLYGWLAYAIYDDFLDDEGNPLLLSAANLFSRKLAEQYAALDKSIFGATALLLSIMDEIDEANMWEQINCRIPKDKKGCLPKNLPSFGNYDNLASRSIGHALGPLTILLSLGHERGSKEFLAAESFFRHYLIARQLHDDAHDWADDLMRGRITSVGTLILEKYKPESHSSLVADNLPALKKFFWTKTIDDTVAAITSHIAAAHHALEISGVVHPTFMETALLSLERGAQKALSERDEALKFLEEYRTTTLRELP
jgi:hypothetical protein